MLRWDQPDQQIRWSSGTLRAPASFSAVSMRLSFFTLQEADLGSVQQGENGGGRLIVHLPPPLQFFAPFADQLDDVHRLGLGGAQSGGAPHRLRWRSILEVKRNAPDSPLSGIQARHSSAISLNPFQLTATRSE